MANFCPLYQMAHNTVSALLDCSNVQKNQNALNNCNCDFVAKNVREFLSESICMN